VEAMVQSTVSVLDQGLVVHTLVLQDLDPAHPKNGQEVDQGLALILLKRHLDPQQEAGPDPQLLDQQLGRPDQGLGADQDLQRGQQDQSLAVGQDQVLDPLSKHGVDLNLGPQDQAPDPLLQSRQEVDLNLVPQDQIHDHP